MRVFQALEPGQLFLFKLHSQRNFVVGGGVFAHATLLPVSLAWESFGLGNGAELLGEMRERIEKYRRSPIDCHADYTIVCIVFTQPFVLNEGEWIPVPRDWKPNIVQGKGYYLTQGEGRELFRRLQQVLEKRGMPADSQPLAIDPPAGARFGTGQWVMPRLGQGAFRVLVTDAYARRCAVTGERVLPVLEAVHIRPYAGGGPHHVENGLLLRSDLHTRFDRGYVTVTPEHRLEVSGAIRDEFHNGRDYYALRGREIQLPGRTEHRPSREHLLWHNETVFRA
jgi:putative restriction endonuclease